MHREVLRGAIWNLAGYVIAGIATVFLPLVLIKSAGRSAYGVYSYVMLLLTQAYLLLGGAGEALAFYLVSHRQEARFWVRQALGAALATGLLGFGLWQAYGPEALTALLGLEAPWQSLLSELRFITGLALAGQEVSTLLGWVPLALGHRRGLMLLPLGQLFTQVLVPIGVAILYPRHVRLLFEVTLYGGILLGLYMWAAVSLLLRDFLWPSFSLKAWKALWQRGLWQSLAQWNGLFLNLFERTLIGRWVSLGYMGLYGAGQYFSSKAFQLLYKATESLLPAFGGEVSRLRQHLRLGQTIWLIGFVCTPSLILLYALGLWLLPYGVSPWSLLEMRLWAGLLLSTNLLFLLVPLMPFCISQGKFGLFYAYSVIVGLFQVGATMVLVPGGFYYWAPAVGAAAGLSFFTLFGFRGWGTSTLWRAWVLPSFVRLCMAWAIAFSPLLSGGTALLYLHLLSGGVGAVFFLAGERYGYGWKRKLSFLSQVGQAGAGFIGTHVQRLWRSFSGRIRSAEPSRQGR